MKRLTNGGTKIGFALWKRNAKRILIVILAIVMVFCLVGCQQVQDESNECDFSMFVYIEKSPRWMIVYHKETKVMYAVSNGENYGNFVLLVDADGSPLLWEGKD